MGVYILICNNGRYYIGSTNNISRRIKEHDAGTVQSTKNLRPLKLILFQQYETLKEARKIELKLKSFKNKKIIEQIIHDGKIITVG